MARRPDEVQGSLVFQEGKCIEGEFYIIAVYDDPATCSVAFAAYELENDSTYTYPLTYTEFDTLFQYDSELMNPSNTDGRFHWVIERLDFVIDNRGQKVICLAQEKTPEHDDDMPTMEKSATKSKGGLAPAAYGGGGIDAATRAKLLKELDTQDDAKLHAALVKSESARKKFLADLHAKRSLEQLKAQQRLAKADEEREERLAKLDQIKKIQAAKAELHKASEDAKKSTMATLEVLMKQKEAQAIRRLIQDKADGERGVGKERDAARQRRRMQERTAREMAEIENQRAIELGRKRDEAVARYETRVVKKNRQIAEMVRKDKEKERFEEVQQQARKDELVAARSKQKRIEARNLRERRDKFARLEELRDRMNEERDRKRALAELSRLLIRRETAQEELEATMARRAKQHKEYLLRWRTEAANRVVAVSAQRRKQAQRDKRIEEREEARIKKFRESQFLDTLKTTQRSLGRGTETENIEDGGEAAEAQHKSSEEAELAQRTYEAMERQRRQAEREEKRRQEEAKKGKMQQLFGKDPREAERIRIAAWKQKDEDKRKALEDARVRKELAYEAQVLESLEHVQQRREKWEELEEKRGHVQQDRERKRMENVIARCKALPLGTALPKVLLY